ncbi:hypothetical protein EDF57_11413 [Novosphingobium sp. PhB55]|nr:hypothetical protein EDF57_11413 [Novosphingobium sp. PhB55]
MSNCQTVGLANCLQAQAPDVAITPLDPGKFKARPWRANLSMRNFERLLIYPPARQEVPNAKVDRIGKHVELPIITFRGYHPDLIYIFNRAKPLSGPISHYHSAIAFACYLQGINAANTIAYFTGAFFEQCGYFEVWSRERDRLLADFDAVGVNIRPYFRDWGRTTSFMYSYNHPRIKPLYDMASALLLSVDRTPHRSDLIPHDNLANSAVFAVYPEVGESVGVNGGYEFRRAGDYRSMGLKEYIERCFSLYATLQVDHLKPFPEFTKQVEHIRMLL